MIHLPKMGGVKMSKHVVWASIQEAPKLRSFTGREYKNDTDSLENNVKMILLSSFLST